MEKLKLSFQLFAKMLLVLVMAGAVSFSFIGCDEEEDDEVTSSAWNGVYCGDNGAYTTVANGGTLSGDYATCVEIPANATVTLSGRVLFKQGTILKINEGVTIEGDTSVDISYLIIDKNAKIIALGTASDPITFTSDVAAGSRSQEDWGGIVINGNARINAGDGSADGEGDSGSYGGKDDDDSSGILRYVRIYFAGRLFTGTNELNGLCLQGVGSGTKVDYVQMHNCADDGIEMFGGAVNIKHIVSTGNGDDQIDCTFGWRGKMQFAVAASLDGNDTTFEHDGNEDNHLATPLTNLTYYNVTSINGVQSGDTVRGARLRRGTQAAIYNAYFGDAGGAHDDRCVQAEDAETNVALVSVLIEACGDNGYSDDGEATLTATNVTNVAAPGTPYVATAPFASYSALSSAGASAFAVNGGATSTPPSAVTPPDDDFFDTTATFIGAIGGSNWLSGWTSFPEN